MNSKSEKLLTSFGDIADKYIIEAMPSHSGKASKRAKLLRKPVVLIAAILVFLSLCAFAVYVAFNYLIAFPANEAGKADYNLHIFDTKFVLSVDLPEGTTIDLDNVLYPDGISGAFSNVAIKNSAGIVVGCVGYNIYDMAQISEISEAEFNPLMIYNQIGLGAHYRFTVREKYEIVNDTDELSTALTDVYNDMDIKLEERIDYTEQDYNYGIVSYSKTLPVYVAFELDRNALSPEQIEAIAKSISFAEN
ncbi:MAG: hypothetical protein FWH48_07255 [Oscillospiraceae bacterium]|nr:hypothetical protein [Oscillospiraceae bacterium]